MHRHDTPRWPTAARIAHFWNRYDRSGGPDACWLWLGSRNSSGYGTSGVPGYGNRSVNAHRIAYWLHTGIWPTHNVCHTCDVRLCGNPTHLYDASQSQNIRDAMAKGRFTQYARPGAANHQAKLSQQDVDRIRTDRAAGCTLQAIADRYGVSMQLISMIALNKAWTR